MNRDEIKKRADELISKYDQRIPPINIDLICKKVGIVVHKLDLSELEKDAERPISGFIIKDDTTNKTGIYVNGQDHKERQKFTVAHELGHYFLHMPDDENEFIVSFRGLQNQVEREADIFACEILMPDAIMKSVYNEVPFPTVSYLAGIFGVSKQAMRIRLDELELDYIG